MIAAPVLAREAPAADLIAVWPMNYLEGFGTRAYPVVALTWGLLALSLAVCLIIAALVVAGTLRRGPVKTGEHGEILPARHEGGLRWIYIGTGLSLLALIATLVWTVAVLAKVNSPDRRPGLTIEIVGHQWWWEAIYRPGTPDAFTTANELHIPTGEPVRLLLRGADVIHSFWIPALSGKTDAVPGRVNLAWFQADRPGRYRGQCTEYCGLQHAHMAAFVRAELPGDYARWEAAQRAPAARAPAMTGEALFIARCGACHTVRGTVAGGILGPDLTHLKSRETIAAGTLPNERSALAAWIADPQAVKPGTLMPRPDLSPTERLAVVAYLETLQ